MAWIGGIGAEFTFEALNAAYRALRGGACLLALHKNRARWAGEERGMVLDAGAYAAALEYAAGVEAEVLGKPAREFFDPAVRELGCESASVLAVGDSVETDSLGAAAAGCRTALHRGGAFREDPLAQAPRRPDRLLESVAKLTP